MDTQSHVARSQETASKISNLLQKRVQAAQEKFKERASEAALKSDALAQLWASMTPPNLAAYAVDAAQRSILFWETLWQRGNNYHEHNAQGQPPLLFFGFDTVVDGRTLERPVNYALLRIHPPEGVEIDPTRRPYIVIDPRAGHGPGVGGFKEDSQVGVALRGGHQVYFVTFYPVPQPGQTLLDVTEAERHFVRKVNELHPKAAKPAIMGNCQGGWAAMMIAASGPDETGPIVINGAPMSYWSGAWSEGKSDNPMRYAGGLLGGAWLSSLTADLGNGKFDGAHLVKNFENLNPANSLWDKYYHVYANVDTEPPRFLEFERWWGGFFLMNTEEIEWITQNLFVGNKLWKGDVKAGSGRPFDLRDIKVPIVMFASLGDNITPPQQAFNWVADIYGSTEEIKARGQVIVGLTHQTIGHLGIFVAGSVAKKEHSQIVSVLKTIEHLPPGLYGMEITETQGAGGKVEYSVAFREFRLEDVRQVVNPHTRGDERVFEAVAQLSEFNVKAYELFGRPLVKAISNETSANALRQMHELRVQNWAISNSNPWLSWLAPAAKAVRENRKELPADHPLRVAERAGSDMLSASLDYYRGMRDAMTENQFFTIFANMRNLQATDDDAASPAEAPVPPAERPYIKEALAAISEGGYAEALVRVWVLLVLRPYGGLLELSNLQLAQQLFHKEREYMPEMGPLEMRLVRGRQEIIVRHDAEQALATLPALLRDDADRERLLAWLDRLDADAKTLDTKPTAEQLEMVERIRGVLGKDARRQRQPAVVQPVAVEPAAIEFAAARRP